jgi:membrane protease YdiL (CAAX protease family)
MISNYKKPGLFYLLSTILPWTFWFVAGYISHLPSNPEQNMNIAIMLALVGLVSPMIIAFLLMNHNPDLRKDFYSRFFNFRSINPWYIFLTCFIMLASILAAMAISLFFGYSPGQFVITGQFTFTSGVLPVWFLLIIAPIFEELAWHSYGTDCLRNKFNLFYTSLIFGAYWAIWHVPLSTIKDYYQANLVESGWIHSLNFMVSIIPYVLIMNWLYYKTKRNILLPIIFHITAVFFNEIFATHPDSKIIQTVLLLILAGYLTISDKKFFFSRDLSLADN